MANESAVDVRLIGIHRRGVRRSGSPWCPL